MDNCGRVRGMARIAREQSGGWVFAKRALEPIQAKENNPKVDISMAKAGMACREVGSRAVEKKRPL